MITIVSGLPRSGTSLMMQMLAAGGMPVLADGVRKADSDNPMGYYELERVKSLKEDSSWLREADGKVFKMIYLLLYDLPANGTYRVVFMERHIDEVIASQKIMLQRRGQPGGGLSDTELKSAFVRHLDRVKQWLAGRPNFSVLYVNYNQLVTNPESVVFDLVRFLGPGLDARRMAAAVDPALYRQRRPARSS